VPQQEAAGDAQRAAANRIFQSSATNAAAATAQGKGYLQSMVDTASATAASFKNSLVGNADAGKDAIYTAGQQTVSVANQKMEDAQEAMKSMSLKNAQEKANQGVQLSKAYLQDAGDSVSGTVTSICKLRWRLAPTLYRLPTPRRMLWLHRHTKP